MKGIPGSKDYQADHLLAVPSQMASMQLTSASPTPLGTTQPEPGLGDDDGDLAP
jgi:hypothetical protein